MLNAMMKEVRCALTAESIKVANMIGSPTLADDVATKLRKVETLIDEARHILFDLEH